MQSEDGTVSKTYTIRILTENGVSVSQQKGSTDEMMVIAKGEILETRVFSDPVSRNLIRYFARKFGVAIHLFYS